MTIKPFTFVDELPSRARRNTDWGTVAAVASADPTKFMAAKRLDCRQGINKQRLAVHNLIGEQCTLDNGETWIFVRYVGPTPTPVVATKATTPPAPTTPQQRTTSPFVRCCGLPERAAA